jgi:hypothetical protein
VIKTSSDWLMNPDQSRIDQLLEQCRSSDPDQQVAAIKALEEAIRMLNVIEDVTEWKVPPSLAQDAPSIRQALQALIRRYPFFHNQASGIMDRLATFESGRFAEY